MRDRDEVQKYIKKPVVVEAIQFTGRYPNTAHVSLFVGYDGIEVLGTDDDGQRYAEIKTLEGTMTAREGDYIIKGVQGEVYPCKPDIFEATYRDFPDGEGDDEEG